MPPDAVADRLRQAEARREAATPAREVTRLPEAGWRLSRGWDSGAALIPLFHDRLAAAVSARLTGAA